MQWYGSKVPFTRFLGEVDQDDPTNIPVGLASLCQQMEFSRDTGGPTQAVTRPGVNLAIQCTDPTAPVTGLVGFEYSPEFAGDPFFQFPLAFQETTGSQFESPVGSGIMVKFPTTNFTEPTGSVHAIDAVAGNKVFRAYSDLNQPLSPISNIDPKARTMNPYGMKPVGFAWQPRLAVLKGELCTPPGMPTGNGHTYQAQNSGTTGGGVPVFPLTEGGTVVDGGVTWKEQTMVIANRVPPPPSTSLALAGGGTIASAQDVYIVVTLVNMIGETLPSVPIFITTLASSSTVVVTNPTLAEQPGWVQTLAAQYIPFGCNIYTAIVAHGAAAPALSSYQLVNVSPNTLGAPTNVFGPGTGVAPPNFCSARTTPGQLPTPVVAPAVQRSPAGAVVNPPGPPTLSQVADSSASGAGVVLTFALTLLNASGETTLGVSGNITIAVTGNDINVSVASSYGPSVTGVNLYTLLMPGGWELVNAAPIPLGTLYSVPHSLVGTAPPATNTATLPAGSFAGQRDVYVAMTYTNANGETPLGPPGIVINTNPNDSIIATPSVPLGPDNVQFFSISMVGLYEADVPTGTPAPPASAFSLVGYYLITATPFITATATGPNPPITNTTGPGGAIKADTATGGPNGTQGYRYAAFGWINQMETFSGFSLASVVSTIIDEDGWELGAYKIPTGMPNVVGRFIAFGGADGSQAGPFNWIGLVDLIVPTQNIVYPTQTLSDNVEQSATVILDNVTTQAIFNFTDSFLQSENNVDDRLDIAIPPTGVRIDYLASVDRVAITGVPGFNSGTWISLGSDYESFYGDNSPVAISSAGDRCFGVTDSYKGIPFAMMASGGFALTPNTGDPESWSANRRWGGIDPAQQLGPCGFRAWCACGKFIIFAHRSGLYKYDMSDPDLMSKEVPRRWAKINWQACDVISVTIDEDTHTVRVLVPTGASTAPDTEYVLSYIEGWNNPIHFSTYSGKEISMDAARRWNFNPGISAYICARLKRTLPPGGNLFLDGPTYEVMPDSSFLLTQLLYASSGNDGSISARTPGIYQDNGNYIDYQYETVSAGLLQAVCKPEGFNLNAAGSGMLNSSFLASRAEVTGDGGEQKLIQVLDEVVCDPIPLTPRQIAGITRKVGPSINEFWRVRFRGDQIPGSWVALKSLICYVIPWTGGRDSGDQ